MKNLFYLFLASLLIVACKNEKTTTTSPPYTLQKSFIGDSAMVVAAHPEATKVGLAILKQGGNAVDAAVAVQLTLAVVYQRAGNIGGGGFMIYRPKNGAVEALDYREKAPLAATRDMYLDSAKNVVNGLSETGHLSVGVPGTVAGIFASHEKYGKLPFKTLIQPAIDLAENGFYVTKAEAEVLNEKMPNFKEQNTTMPVFVKDEPWKEGDKIIQKDLAETLKRIRDNGKAGFYEGKTADLFVAEMKAGNGIITLEDLKNYDAKWRTPIQFEYDNYNIYSMPPPSSGGIALAQLLGMVEAAPLNEWGFQSTKSVHRIVEAERRAYADRSEHLGDMDFYNVPIDSLVSETYLAERISNMQEDKATDSDSIRMTKLNMIPESEQTTHLSVVDKYGNAVSITTTLNSSYGSKVVVTGGGFVLNNEMDDFSAKPGVPNLYGLIGKEANAIQPSKRMLSSMTPTIVEKDSSLFMVVGTPGGSTIITSVFQVFLNVAEYGMNLDDAVNKKRFHHQWLPNKISIEEGAFTPEVIKELEAMGHVVEVRDAIGRVDAILVRADGKLEGVGDSRGDDCAEGF